ncbi:putative protein kinase RLK-Pelle-Extensin family [Helianthus annuus]|nr:putative protein kinase RLK-Pelle-Extensin family [Helianthus annuus]
MFADPPKSCDSAGVSYCCSVWHGDVFLRFLLRFQIFTFKQLLSATGGFGKSNVIGQGGFGSVYRGVLQDGRKIAVKLMDQAGKQGEEEFRVEVEMLSRLCSPYLLALIGYCSESHHRVLVYDFLANGGLQEHLYPIKGMEFSKGRTNTRNRDYGWIYNIHHNIELMYQIRNL